MDITLQLGGYTIRVHEPKNYPCLAWPIKPFDLFLCQPESKPDMDIAVTVVGPLPSLPIGPLQFDAAHGLWKLFSSDSSFVIESLDTQLLQPRVRALVSADFLAIHAWVLPELRMGQVGWSPMHLINPILEICLLLRLARGGGLLLHAAGLSLLEQGFVFTGDSGTGKSTISQFFAERNAQVFSDERIIIRQIDGRFIIHGTPWVGSGNYAANDSTPLTKLYCISHGAGSHATSALSQRAVAQELIRQSFLPHWDREAMETTMETIGDLVRRVDCLGLAPLKSPDIVDYLLAQGPLQPVGSA